MRIPLTYTFGNHMHWVDMEWLWGYHVLPGSIRDMLHFCSETGAKGNVNFDGVGYEKVAAEDPEALAELREAVRAGTVEVVGASYGQPYGGFHGGESNIRQRVYGVRAAMRLFGVRPHTFWEEEFDFFPQLPQILTSAGFDGAALFYQWTWHTPEVPYEDVPVIEWEGHDGSRLRAATRNRLNLHQWPEDVDAMLADIGKATPDASGVTPLVLQWLELMPSPDWMCRSEVLLPKTKELLADERFDIRFATLGQYLRDVPGAGLPVRRYGPDDVFHGMSLGKNGDGFRRLSREAEASLLTAETFAAIAGLFGRPYAQWDVYPTWELEEGWRELLQAQHHDNDECEGLCGHVGKFSYERSLSLSGHVGEQTLNLLTNRIDAPEGTLVVFNPLGWPVDSTVPDPDSGAPMLVKDVPAMGWRTVAPEESVDGPEVWTLSAEGAIGRLGDTEVIVDDEGRIAQIRTKAWPDGVLNEATPLLRFRSTEAGEEVEFALESMEIDPVTQGLVVRFHHPKQGGIRADVRLVPGIDAVDVSLAAGSLLRPDGGMNAGIQTKLDLHGGIQSVVTDSPYAVHEVEAKGTFRKKYPTGDWMTSEQWFEEIVRPFDAYSFVDLIGAGGAGLLVIHDGSPQWFRDEDGVRNLLTMYDPWDEDYWVDRFQVSYRLVPHTGLSNAERWRAAQSFVRPPMVRTKGPKRGTLPATFSALSCGASGAVVTAFYRETLEASRGLDGYAARDFGRDYPYVMRVVELDGNEATSPVKISATVAKAAKTNVMGERLSDLPNVTLDLRPFEIATVTLDLVEGRKQIRDLDAKREIWATVHRTENS